MKTLRASVLLLVVFLLQSVSAIAAPPNPADPVATPHTLSVLTHTYVCDGKTPAGTSVQVMTGAGAAASVFINAGCPSGFRAEVWTCTDGAHVHDGAGGTAAKEFYFHIAVHWTGRCGAVHQDGVQLMGGQHIRCEGCTTSGVLSAGSNGAWFLSEGSGGHQLPTDDICHGCWLVSNNTAVVIGRSAASGAEFSHLRGVMHGCVRLGNGARVPVSPVNRSNVCGKW